MMWDRLRQAAGGVFSFPLRAAMARLRIRPSDVEELPHHYMFCSAVLWLGVDRRGCVAGFVTEYDGPVAHAAAAAGPIELEETWERVLRLPAGRPCEFRPLTRDHEELVGLVERGLYAYEWTEERAKAGENAFVLVASPVAPVRVDELPEGLAWAARAAELPIEFATTTRLEVGEFLRTVQGQRGWYAARAVDFLRGAERELSSGTGAGLAGSAGVLADVRKALREMTDGWPRAGRMRRIVRRALRWPKGCPARVQALSAAYAIPRLAERA